MAEFDYNTVSDEILIGEEEDYKDMGINFDEDHEFSIYATFHDGFAIPDNLNGYKLVYPTIDEVKKSEAMQEEITAYTGRDFITPFEVALKYGRLVIDK